MIKAAKATFGTMKQYILILLLVDSEKAKVIVKKLASAPSFQIFQFSDHITNS